MVSEYEDGWTATNFDDHHKWDIELLLQSILVSLLLFSFIHFGQAQNKKLTCIIVSFIDSNSSSYRNSAEKKLRWEDEEICIPNDARKWRFNLKQIKYKSKNHAEHGRLLTGRGSTNEAWILKKKN